MKSIIKKIVNNKMSKVVMSVLVISSSIPTILQDLEDKQVDTFEHYGVMLLGLFYLFQAIIDITEMWFDE